MTELGRRLVDEIEREGGSLPAELAEAFAAVPREAFVAEGFQRRDGTWASPGTAGFLDTVYSDDVLVTKVDDGQPVSSSSQPSLMAIMLDALDARPGDRVLEIGAGTGYNAALLTRLGAAVTSVDLQADVAERARAALRSAGIAGVRVLAGDGYAGAPGERFGKAIVTVGVAGVSPHWLEQVQPGPIVVPVQHAGTHPVLLVHGTPQGPVTASVICPAGFMTAAGPLTAARPAAHPAPVGSGVITGLHPVVAARWRDPLPSPHYRDLWYAAGAWSTRATHAALPGQRQNILTLLDSSGTGGAAILPDGAVLAGGPEASRYAADAVAVLNRWEAAGRPPMQAWRIILRLTGDPQSPIWAPASWELG